jgi:peptidyl-prolyl cis-trans isomerase C
MRKCIWIVGSLLLVFVFFQTEAFSQDDGVVAKIGERNITVSDFNRIVGYFDSERQKMVEQNPQFKDAVLRQLVQSMVISDLAKAQGFDKKPEIKEQLLFFTDNYLANEYLKREVAQKVTVSDADVKSYYEDHKEEFRTPEMVKASHILVKVDRSASEEEKKKAKEKATDILNKAKSGEDFAKLASELSDDPGSKTKGGDLGFFAKGRMVKPFEDAAFSLKPGEISGLVESQYGFHIIKVEEKKEPSLEPFDKVQEQIRQKLIQESIKTKITEFIDKAMKDSKTEIYSDVLTGEKK